MKPILFVFGPARGGTTYLTDMLDEWFDYGMGPEGTYIKHFYSRRGRYGNLRNPENLTRLINHLSQCEMLEIMRYAWPDSEKVDITPNDILAQVESPCFKSAAYAVLAAVAAKRGKHHLGSKDPSFWRYWPILEELFGKNARYLCIIRDGRDVALSLFRQSWGEKSAYIAAKNWVAFMDVIHAIGNSAAGDRLKIITYEGLLTSPTSTLSEIEEFTKTRLTSEKRSQLINTIKTSEYVDNFNKWKQKMSCRDIAIFESVAGRWLRHYGYDIEESGYSITWAERSFYEIEEFVRKSLLTISRQLGFRTWQK